MTVSVEAIGPMASPAQAPAPGAVRPTTLQDRDRIVQVAIATGVFTEYEIETVNELLDGYYDDPVVSGYNFLSYSEGDRLLGFATWGPRDLAEHGYDLYWIATHPAAQRRGVAQALMDGVESVIRRRGGGWLWVETSSTPAYAAARDFYRRCGYQVLAVLDDFYHDGDALTIFVKWIA